MLVLFDIDDTLIDHTAAVRAGVAALYAEIQPTVALATFYATWLVAMKEHFPRYLRGEVPYQEQRRARLRQTVATTLTDVEADDLFARYFSAYEARWSLFPDVVPCLAELAAHQLGIISNGNGTEQRSKLDRTGIADRFQFVHISAECGYAKPAGEIFRLACQAAAVSPADAAYVGDLYEIDALPARQAGLQGVWLNRGGSSAADHAPPIVRGLAELSSILGERVV
jgi:putative hydrolase of the HAD superfamily